ncbi:hypothetical protein L6452_35893 [Arctium lappa]|uniref:Uncharacterized protein n=1 Tax=Arctium lappa TaxID=4217 RepID=A0ACB8Y735_ARCLA|nr:hypothetical protein L6452_35893 [Arctium lappa]
MEICDCIFIPPFRWTFWVEQKTRSSKFEEVRVNGVFHGLRLRPSYPTLKALPFLLFSFSEIRRRSI